MKKLLIALFVLLPFWAISQTPRVMVLPMKPKANSAFSDSLKQWRKALGPQLLQPQILKNQPLKPGGYVNRGRIMISQIDGMAVIIPDVTQNASMPVGSSLYFLFPQDAMPIKDNIAVPNKKK